MFDLPFHSDSISFIQNLKALHATRKKNMLKNKRELLSKKDREAILLKTDNKCHVCGITLTEKFEADHVKSYSSGGTSTVENYLPSCKMCNNYRWHYNPGEKGKKTRASTAACEFFPASGTTLG